MNKGMKVLLCLVITAAFITPPATAMMAGNGQSVNTNGNENVVIGESGDNNNGNNPIPVGDDGNSPSSEGGHWYPPTSKVGEEKPKEKEPRGTVRQDGLIFDVPEEPGEPEPIGVPLLETSFEEPWVPDSDGDNAPPGWEVDITNTECNGCYPCYWSQYTYAPHSGTYHAGLWWSPNHQDEWLKTPQLNLAGYGYAKIRHWAWYHGSPPSPWEDSHWCVEISKDNWATYTTLRDFADLSYGWHSYEEEYVIDIPSDFLVDGVSIAWHAYDTKGNGLFAVVFVDDVIVEVPPKNDVGVKSIDWPPDPCPTGDVPIEATVINYGTDDQGSFPVECNVYEYVSEVILLEEDFAPMGEWPPDGWEIDPAHSANWMQYNGNLAGGEPPEARFYYYPSFVGESWLETYPIDTGGFTELELAFRTYVSHYTGSYHLQIRTSPDGSTWYTPWDILVSSSIPAHTEYIDLTTAHGVGSSTFYIRFYFVGDSWNINWWNFDDVLLHRPGGAGDLVYTGTATVSSLASGAETSVTFDPVWHVPDDWEGNDYLIVAHTMLPGDEVPENDYCEKPIIIKNVHDIGVKSITVDGKDITVCNKLAVGKHIIDTEIGNFGNKAETDVPLHATIWKEKYVPKFHSDMEKDVFSDWITKDGNCDGDTWHLSTARYHSPEHSMKCTKLDEYKQNALDTLEMRYPVDLSHGDDATLQFWYWVEGEEDLGVYYDYLDVYLSDDNGATWVGPVTVHYEFENHNYYWNRMSDSDGWTLGDVNIGDYVDLTGYVKCKFVWHSDTYKEFEGAYIDDVWINETIHQGSIVWESLLQVDINPGEQLHFDFPQYWDVHQYGIYWIEVHQKLADSNPENDWLKLPVEVVPEYFHDVGVVDVDASPNEFTLIPFENKVYINATIANYGPAEEKNFDVKLTINRLSESILFSDDIESGEDDWVPYNFGGAGDCEVQQWHITEMDSVSPTHSWYMGTEMCPELKQGFYPNNCFGQCLGTPTWDISEELATGTPIYGEWKMSYAIETSASPPAHDSIWMGVVNPVAHLWLRFTGTARDGYTDWHSTDLEDWFGIYGCTTLNDVYEFANDWFVGNGYPDMGGEIALFFWFQSDDAGHEYPGVGWSGVFIDDVELRSIAVGEEIITETKTISELAGQGATTMLSFHWKPRDYGWYGTTVETLLPTDVNPKNDKGFDDVKIWSTWYWNKVEQGEEGWTHEDLIAGKPTHWHIVVSEQDHFWWCGEDSTNAYGSNWDESLMTKPIDLTWVDPDNRVRLTFKHEYFIETGWDYGYVDVSADGGTNWYNLAKYTGIQSSWTEEILEIPPEYWSTHTIIRFRFTSDVAYEFKGWFIDDVFVEECLYEYIEEGSAIVTSFEEEWVPCDGYDAPPDWTVDGLCSCSQSGYPDLTHYWSRFDFNAGYPLPHSGDWCAGLWWSDGSCGDSVQNEWLITPILDLTGFASANVTFYSVYTMKRYGTNPDQHDYIQISVDGGDWEILGDLRNDPEFDFDECTGGPGGYGWNWNEVPIVIDLTEYCGHVVNIAWNYYWGGSGSAGIWMVDDVNAGALKVIEIWTPLKDWFEDDMESGPGKWTSTVTTGGDLWHITDYCYHSPTHSWFCGNEDGTYNNLMDDALTSTPIDLTTSYMAQLIFWTWYDIEEGYDFGYVKISDDGGATWSTVKQFTGSSGWTEEKVNLRSFVGKTIMIRFEFVSDSSGTATGWQIDDIRVRSMWDINPPRTECHFSEEPNHGWLGEDVRITLMATDDISGVEKTLYKLDDGEWTTYTESIVVSEEGEHSISYHSIDNCGNEEEVKTTPFRIDKEAPTMSISAPREGYLYFFGKETIPIPTNLQSFLGKTLIIGWTNVEVDAFDDASGIEKVEFYVDDGLAPMDDDYSAPYTATLDIRGILKAHTVKAVTYDFAGNSVSEEIEFKVINLL